MCRDLTRDALGLLGTLELLVWENLWVSKSEARTCTSCEARSVWHK